MGNQKYMSSITAGFMLIGVLLAVIFLGKHTMGAFAGLLALAGWLHAGAISRQMGVWWMLSGVLIVILTIWNGTGIEWTEGVLFFGSAVLLYQSLDTDGRLVARIGCLLAASVLSIVFISTSYLTAAGYGTFAPFPARFFENTNEAGLFFVIALLCDTSRYRKALFGIVLGFLHTGAGLLAAAIGLWNAKTRLPGMMWVFAGFSLAVFPARTWPFVILFFFMAAEWAKQHDKYRWIVFVPCLFGSWKWQSFSIPDIQVVGIILTILIILALIPCIKQVIKHPAGKAMTAGLLFHACFPSVFLLGAGCGVGNKKDNNDKVDGRLYFGIFMAICLFTGCGR